MNEWAGYGKITKSSPSVFYVKVKALVERAYRRAKDLIQSNIDILHKSAAVLMERESIEWLENGHSWHGLVIKFALVGQQMVENNFRLFRL